MLYLDDNLRHIIEDIKTLCDTDSYSENRDGLLEVLIKIQGLINNHLGLNSRFLDSGSNPILLAGDDNATIMILSHADTVWDNSAYVKEFSIEDGKLFGPGVFDMKGGIVGAIHAVKNAKIDSSRVKFLITTDEEVGSEVSKKYILEEAKKSKYVLVFEPPIDECLKIARKGVARLAIKISAGADQSSLTNLHNKLANYILKFSNIAGLGRETTITPTICDSTYNSFENRSTGIVVFDIRSYYVEDFYKIENIIEDYKKLEKEDNSIISSFTYSINCPPFNGGGSSELLSLLNSKLKSQGYVTFEGRKVGGASDANLIEEVNSKIVDGLGLIGGGAHSQDEHILIDKITERIEAISHLIEVLPTLE